MRFAVNIDGQFGSLTGIQYYTDSLLTALCELGPTSHEISAYAGRPLPGDALASAARRNPGTFRWLNQPEIRLDIGVNRIPLPRSFREKHRDLTRRVQDAELRMFSSWRGGANDRARRYDVLHFPQPTDLSFWDYRPRRSVSTIHDLSVRLFPEAFPPFLVDLWDEFFRFSKERCSRVLTVSEASRRDIIEHLGIPKERIDVTPNAPRLSASHMDDTDSRRSLLAELGLAEVPFVLYSGTLEPRKNLVRLVRAFAAVVREDTDLPHRLVLAGGAWENHRELLEDTARREGLTKERLAMPGYVTNDQLNAMMSACDLFAYVSLYEGFGMPPLEAMACGAPVLSSLSSSLPEVLGEAAVFVDPTDDAAIAIELYRILTDSAENVRLRDASHANVARFGWQRSARLTLESYEQAAS